MRKLNRLYQQNQQPQHIKTLDNMQMPLFCQVTPHQHVTSLNPRSKRCTHFPPTLLLPHGPARASANFLSRPDSCFSTRSSLSSAATAASASSSDLRFSAGRAAWRRGQAGRRWRVTIACLWRS